MIKRLNFIRSRLLRRERRNGQGGFTLIELLVGLAITGAIAGGITFSIFQTLDYNARSNARMIAVKEVENVVHYLSRDVQMAQVIEVTADADGFPLTLSWVEWNGTENTVVYSLSGSEITRQHIVDGSPESDRVLASHVDTDADDTNCDFTNYVFSYRLTSTLDGYPGIISETREGQIKPRAS